MVGAVLNGAELIAHTVHTHHLAGNGGGGLNVATGTAGDVAKDNLLGAATAHRHHDIVEQLALVLAVLVLVRQHHGNTQCRTAGNDGDLVQRQALAKFCLEQADGVTGLVDGCVVFLLVRDFEGAALTPPAHLLAGLFQIALTDGGFVAASGDKRSLVDQVGQLSAGESGGGTCNRVQVDTRVEFHLAGMYTQNLLTAGGIGQVNDNLTVEAPRAQKCRVEHVHTVGGGYHNDVFVGGEAVHLHQQGVEGLLALIVTTAHAVTAVATYCVNFIDKDKAGGVFLGLGKHVAHATGTHTYKHFHKVRAGDGVEGYIGLACNSLGQQGFTCTGRANHQHTLGNGTAQIAELSRVAQELNDFPHFFLGFGDAGNILEGNLILAGVEQSCAAAGKLHGSARATALSTEQEYQDDENQHHRQAVDEYHLPCVALNFVNGMAAEHVAHLITLEGATEGYADRLYVFAVNSTFGIFAVLAHYDALGSFGVGVVYDRVFFLGVENSAFLTEFAEILGGNDLIAKNFRQLGVVSRFGDAVAIEERFQLLALGEGHVERSIVERRVSLVSVGIDNRVAGVIIADHLDGEFIRLSEHYFTLSEVFSELIEGYVTGGTAQIAVGGEGKQQDAGDNGHENPQPPVRGTARGGRKSVFVLVLVCHGLRK